MTNDQEQLTVLYENGRCLVVFKPPGVLTQAPAGIDSLEIRLKQWLATRDGASGEVYLGVPHRLDRPVSGAMVFGTDRRTTRRLGKQFERRQVKKVYWACVEGEVQPAEGTWDDPVRKVPDVAQAEIVAADHPDARSAVLHYRTLGLTAHGSWLEIELETGRYHQIRLQASARGYPVLGDEPYGSRLPFGPQHDDTRLRAIALHARELSFRDPTSHQAVAVIAEPPAAWELLVPMSLRENG